MYSAKLRALYDYLPPDKQISRGTLAAWRAFLLEAGYSPSTVNTHLSAANGLMEYMGRRDLQLVGQLEADKGLQPELSPGGVSAAAAGCQDTGKGADLPAGENICPGGHPGGGAASGDR